MTGHADIADRWVRWREGKVDRPLEAQGGNVHVDLWHPEQILSYGRHFPLAVDMGDWWLLNGDTYSPSTTQHQALIRGAIQQNSDRTQMIVPFSALEGAGIMFDTIKPVNIQDDTFTYETDRFDSVSDAPEHLRNVLGRLTPGTRHSYFPDLWREDDGTYCHRRRVHWLGASLFYAETRTRERCQPDDNGAQWVPAREAFSGGIYRRVTTQQGMFLSAFDQQERTPLYFLAQLPQDADPHTVDDAFVSLRPQVVNDAMASGRNVARQGDVFAFDDASEYCNRKSGTRRLKRDGATIEKRQRPTRRQEPPYTGWVNPADGGKVAGTDHAASEVATLPDGTEYARGCLYHDVHPRLPEHARRRISDGKTWHRIMLNTVPWSQGAPRAYTIRGGVD